jgi:hypothetical protein
MNKEKISNLITTIETQAPDILCLTSVTSAVFKSLNSTFNERYVSFQVFEGEEEEHGTVIFCNKETTEISEEEQPYYFDYPKGKGRIIGTGVVHLRSKMTFNILTADIDTLNESIRNAQVDTLKKVLSEMKETIILGDVGDLQELNFRDAWVKIGCPRRLLEENRETRTFYDSRFLIPKSMSLIGTKTLRNGNTVSPYLGLETIFQINRKPCY